MSQVGYTWTERQADGQVVSLDDRRQVLGRHVFQILVETIEDYAIIALDPDGRVVHWNAGAVRTLGYSSEEAFGKDVGFIFTDEDQSSHVPQQELRVATLQGRSEDERWHVRKDGSRFWAIGVLVPARDPQSDALIGFGKILRDRTDLKQMQEALRNQAADFAKADQNKDQFIATLAHELRNPLAVFMSGVGLLKKKTPLPNFDRVIEMMERQVVHTQKLIEDLLDLARMGRNKLELSRSKLDLRDILIQAGEMARVSMDERKHDFICDLPGLPLMVSGDAHRLVQVFLNLLNNATKFSNKNGIITLTAVAEGNEAVVRVVDNGIGIAPEQLVSIFGLFAQAKTERPESQLGLGIGLALTRDLVALHEGTVQARSQGIGKGSDFIVRLPLIDGVQTIAPN